jgi:hypothetical protein
MATLSATAALYNAFKLKTVDKNAIAAITSTASLSCSTTRAPFVRAGIRAKATVSATPGFAIYGGVAKDATTLQAVSTLRCKFPTYVKLNWDKLNLPEGTTVVLKVERDFVREGVFPESINSALPKNNNLITFRTPKKLFAYLTSSATIVHTTLRIKQLASAISGAMTFVSTARANKVGVTSLDSAFTTSILANFKSVNNFAVMNAQATVSAVTGFLKGTSSNNSIVSSTTIASANARIRFGVSAVTATSTTSVDGLKYTGIVANTTASATMTTSAIRIKGIVKDLSAQFSITAIPTRTSGAFGNINSNFGIVTNNIATGPTNAPNKSWRGLAVHPITQEVYAMHFGTPGELWKQSTPTSPWQLVKTMIHDGDTLQCQGIAFNSSGDLWICTYGVSSESRNGDIFVMYNGTTDLNPLSQTRRYWRDIHHTADGQIWAVAQFASTSNRGGIYQWNGSSFAALNSYAWTSSEGIFDGVTSATYLNQPNKILLTRSVNGGLYLVDGSAGDGISIAEVLISTVNGESTEATGIETSPSGRLWICSGQTVDSTGFNGKCGYRVSSGQWQPVHVRERDYECIAITNAGVVYAGAINRLVSGTKVSGGDIDIVSLDGLI